METSKRLYTHAKEIQLKKNLLKEAYTPEYDFTPKLTGFTGKWLQIKKNIKKPTEIDKIAVVSARAHHAETDFTFSRSLTPIL